MKTFSVRHLAPSERSGRYRVQSRYWLEACMVLATLFLGGASAAQAADTRPPDRLGSLTVFGKDPCPQGADGEIVVCGRELESERYRIPKALRETKYQPPAQSWASRVHTLDDASRAGRPNSCSVVGTGGQTGCYPHALEQWFAERR